MGLLLQFHEVSVWRGHPDGSVGKGKLSTEHNELSWITRTYMVEGEKTLTACSLAFDLYLHKVAHTHTNEHMKTRMPRSSPGEGLGKRARLSFVISASQEAGAGEPGQL